MNRYRFLIGASLLGVLVLAGPARAAVPAGDSDWGFLGGATQTEKFSKTVSLGKTGTVEVSNIAGNIVITGGAGDQVVIEALKKGRTTDELKLVTIEVSSTAGRVEVRTRYPEGQHNISVSVDYAVTVPKGAAVSVKSISGDEKVTGVDGEMHAASISGEITIASSADVRSLKSVSGDVAVSASGTGAELSVSTISGELTLTGVKAHELLANTISGDQKLTDVTASRIGTKTISGEVTFSGPLAKGGRYEFQAHSGDIKLMISDKVGFEVTASTFSGDFNSDLPLTMKFGGGDTPEPGRGGRGRRPPNQTVRGTYGDGAAVLVLNSFSGDIKIIKK